MITYLGAKRIQEKASSSHTLFRNLSLLWSVFLVGHLRINFIHRLIALRLSSGFLDKRNDWLTQRRIVPIVHQLAVTNEFQHVHEAQIQPNMKNATCSFAHSK